MINLKMMLTEDRNNSISHGCLMAMLSKEVSEKIINFGKRVIGEDQLYTEGNEFGRESESHVTIKYGFTKDLNELEIRQLLKDQKPFMVEIFGLDKFTTNPKFDVAVFKVNSPVLSKLNEAASKFPNDDEYPEYNPHLTLAYVQKGKFPFVKENMKLRVPIKTLCYSPISGAKTYYDL
jgi:2'-5' RNA ligase